MRKMLAFWLTLTLLALSASALATGASLTLQGVIAETTEEGFLLEDVTMGTVYVLWNDETVYDGTATQATLAAGQYVYVTYDGRLTRSLPPQASADRIGCYTLAGAVGAILDDGFLLEDDEIFGQVIVRVPDGAPHAYQGMRVTVYYDGTMAMSYPGRVTAALLVVPSLAGTVSEAGETGFLLTEDDGTAWQITLSDGTNVLDAPMDGMRAEVLCAEAPTEGQAVEALEVRLAQSEAS